MSDDSRFDPRFDPAFQPGYTGPIAHERPGRQRPAASAPEALPVVAVAAHPVRDESLVLQDSQEELGGRPNPFLIALGVTAILLVGGGLLLVSLLRDLAAGAQSSEFDWITVQAATFGAPMLVVLGLAAGVGLLFLFAAGWDRR